MRVSPARARRNGLVDLGTGGGLESRIRRAGVWLLLQVLEFREKVAVVSGCLWKMGIRAAARFVPKSVPCRRGLGDFCG